MAYTKWDEVTVKDGDKAEFYFNNQDRIIKDKKDIMTIVNRDPQDYNSTYCIRRTGGRGMASQVTIDGKIHYICNTGTLPSYLEHLRDPEPSRTRPPASSSSTS